MTIWTDQHTRRSSRENRLVFFEDVRANGTDVMRHPRQKGSFGFWSPRRPESGLRTIAPCAERVGSGTSAAVCAHSRTLVSFSGTASATNIAGTRSVTATPARINATIGDVCNLCEEGFFGLKKISLLGQSLRKRRFLVTFVRLSIGGKHEENKGGSRGYDHCRTYCGTLFG
jgi:hypothetical protein